MSVPVDDILEIWKRAVAKYQEDPVAWSLLWGAAMGIAIATMGLGLVLAPNAYRVTRDALREDRSPDVADLFKVHTDLLLDDAIAAFGVLVALMVAGTFTGPVAVLAYVLLQMAPPAVTEPDVGGIDALQLSVAHMQRDPGAMLVQGLIANLVNLPVLCCLVPMVVTVPITGIAQWMFYEAHRREILQLPAPSSNAATEGSPGEGPPDQGSPSTGA